MNKSIVFLLLFISTLSFSQKKKVIKQYGIKSVLVEDTKSGKTIPDENIVYGKLGEVLEETKYDSTGVIKAIHKYKYDTNGNEIEENEYDKNGTIISKKISKYSLKGQLTEAKIFDKTNKLVKRMVYFFDGKGLKILRKTFNALDSLISTKKYTYRYK